jgi:hypothetical protein
MWSARSTWCGRLPKYGQRAFGDLLEVKTFGMTALALDFPLYELAFCRAAPGHAINGCVATR